MKVMYPSSSQLFSRNLGSGETGVLNLAVEINPDLLLIDDNKARNEAKHLGFACAFTSDVLIAAEERNLIHFYQAIMDELDDTNIPAGIEATAENMLSAYVL